MRPVAAVTPGTASRTVVFLASLGRSTRAFSAELADARARRTALSLPTAPADLRDLIDRAARRSGADPALLTAIVAVESGFNARAVSHAGAKGLTQLMDTTARAMGVQDPFDPWQNLIGGARYLNSLLVRYRGDLRLALAAYNAGPSAVDRYGGIPPYQETQRYVVSVMQAFQRFRAQSDGGTTDV